MEDYQRHIAEVHARIQPFIIETPLVRSQWLSRLTGNEVYFKCEYQQHTRAFKVRGALNKVLSMDSESIRNKTLVTASGGNHGLAVVYTAKLLGLKSHIVLPESTPQLKIDAVRALGGEVEIAGTAWDEANHRALEISRDGRFVYIHPFDDEKVIDGQATIAYEICRQIEKPALVMASIGGGGLISGIAGYLKSVNPAIRVAGVETAGADSMHQSVQAGRLITLPAITSKAESLGAKRVSMRTLNAVRNHTDALYVVDDSRAGDAQDKLLKHENIHVELAASCVIAAFIDFAAQEITRQTVVIVLCGGNA